MNHELRLTDTNTATDSQGRTWGLEGNLFWWLVGGVGAGIILFFVMVIGFKAKLMLSLGVALIPVLFCVAYIFGLRQGKPPGYDRDIVEFTFRGRGFGPDNATLSGHPLIFIDHV